jgi:hypothetical protein
MLRLVHPPNVATTRVDWTAVERDLGIGLPGDYKRYIDTYGAGAIDGFLWILHPMTRNRHVNLGEQRLSRLDALRNFLVGVDPRVRATNPNPDELMPWGFTENGDVCFWHICGNAETWTVVLQESRCAQWESFDGGMVVFLEALLHRGYRSRIFPEGFPSEAPVFVALE